MAVEMIQSALPAVSALVSSNRTRYGGAVAADAGAAARAGARASTRTAPTAAGRRMPLTLGANRPNRADRTANPGRRYRPLDGSSGVVGGCRWVRSAVRAAQLRA